MQPETLLEKEDATTVPEMNLALANSTLSKTCWQGSTVHFLNMSHHSSRQAVWIALPCQNWVKHLRFSSGSGWGENRIRQQVNFCNLSPYLRRLWCDVTEAHSSSDLLSHILLQPNKKKPRYPDDETNRMYLSALFQAHGPNWNDLDEVWVIFSGLTQLLPGHAGQSATIFTTRVVLPMTRRLTFMCTHSGIPLEPHGSLTEHKSKSNKQADGCLHAHSHQHKCIYLFTDPGSQSLEKTPGKTFLKRNGISINISV